MNKLDDGGPAILVFKTGTVSRYDKAKARKAGFVVLEAENLEQVRLLEPSQQLQSSDLFCAAITSLSESIDLGAKEKFVKRLAGLAERARREGEDG